MVAPVIMGAAAIAARIAAKKAAQKVAKKAVAKKVAQKITKVERKAYKDEGLMFSRESKKLMSSGKTNSMTKANTSKSRSATKPTVPVKKVGKK
jgi:hypothetical protein